MSNLKNNLVYLATGVEILDTKIKQRLNVKNIVTKEIFYSDILIESEIEAKTIILSRKLEGKTSIDQVITKLRELGVRIIFCLSADFEYFDICLKCGVYDVISDPIKPSNIVDVFEKPMEYKDVIKIKEAYDEYLKATGKKIDPIKVLEKSHATAIKKEIDTKNLKSEEQSIKTQKVEELDVDGLFSGLEGFEELETTSDNQEVDILEVNDNQESILAIDNSDIQVSDLEKNINEDLIQSPSNEIMKIGRQDDYEDHKETDDERIQNETELYADEDIDYFSEGKSEEKDKKIRPRISIQLPSLKSKLKFQKKETDENNKTENFSEEENESIVKEEKIASEPKLFQKKKPPKTIGVIGSERSIGTTYTSMLLAYALGRKRKVLYVVTDDKLYSTLSLKEIIENYPFDITLLNDELYKLHNLYDHIIYNCGSMKDNTVSYNIFYTLQQKILMISLLPYKTSSADKNDAAAYVDVIAVLGLQKDEKFMKGIEVRENFTDKKYLEAVERKLLGGNDYE